MSKIAYLPEIDGLRAVAVLAVVLGHAELGLRAGYIGVDVFFVISGYLITSLLRAEQSACGSIDYFAFYARRVRRLIPALVMVVAVTLAAAMYLPALRRELGLTADSAAAALLFLGNVFFQSHTGGYFDPGADRLPLLHLWSLGVEEQFYLLWPFGLALLWRVRANRQALSIAGAGLASLVLCEALLARNPNAAFYEMPARFWELAAGGWIAVQSTGAIANAAKLALAGLSLVLAAMLVPMEHFPGFGALPAVLGAAMLLRAVHSGTDLGLAGALLRSSPAVFLGRISYSLYLWHWPLLVVARASDPEPLSIPARLGLCAAAIVIATLSYRYIETPFRYAKEASDRRIVAAGTSGSLAFALFCTSLAGLFAAPPGDLATRTANDFVFDRMECHYRGDMAIETFPLQKCVTPRNKVLGAAIWGDSHALAWRPFAQTLADHSGVALIPFTRDACSPALDYDNGKRALEMQRCVEFNRRTAEWLGAHALDLLVIAAMWPEGARAAAFDPNFERTLALVAPRAKHIVLIGQTPFLPASVPDCIATGRLAACNMTRAEFESRSHAVRAWLQSLATRYPNVEYIDPVDFFCDAQQCPGLRDGYGLYWDDNHVSATAARAFATQYLKLEEAPPTLGRR